MKIRTKHIIASASLAALITGACGTQLVSAEEPATASATVVVTGSRKAAASIKGLDIEPLRLPQNVRGLGDSNSGNNPLNSILVSG
jgi:hypothetical protein